MTNGIPVIDPTNLTMEKLQAAIDELKAQDISDHEVYLLQVIELNKVYTEN